jgi:hypothetical protein
MRDTPPLKNTKTKHTSKMKTITLYGFSNANASDEPAWFYSREAAERFNAACGGNLGEIETTNDAEQGDIMDTVDKQWTKE